MSEVLTGCYLDFILYPLSLVEVLQANSVVVDLALRKPAVDALLPDVFRYGLHSEIYLDPNPATKQLLHSKLVESYLFKDILAFQRVRYSHLIVDLARALAYQMGSEFNQNKLASRLKIDRKTVLRYIDLHEKSFVITRLPPYSKHTQHEIGKQTKIYSSILASAML